MIGKNKREFVINTTSKNYQLRFNVEKTNTGEEDFVIILDALMINGGRKQIIRMEQSSHSKEHHLHNQFHIHYLAEGKRTENIGELLTQKEKIEKGMEYLIEYICAKLPPKDAKLFRSRIYDCKQKIKDERSSPKYGERTTTIPFSADAILVDERTNKTK